MTNDLYCNIHPTKGESFVDAAIRTVPTRQRVLSGLALKIISIRLKRENDRATEVDLLELQRCENKFERINNMTDEQYEKKYT